MKRTPLRRRTALRARPPRRRARPIRAAAAPARGSAGRLNGALIAIRGASPPPLSRYRQRERHTAYMLWVKHQPCLMRGIWGCCEGSIEGDHAGRRGVGHKAHDSTCIPLCCYHHGASRFPRSWPQAQRRAWLHAATVYTQACRDVDPRDPAPIVDRRPATIEESRRAIAGLTGAPRGARSGHRA